MLSLLQFLIVENQQKLSEAIRRLESFPNLPEFRELRSVQHKLKYSGGTFTLRQVTETPGFLSFQLRSSVPSPWICPLLLSAGDFPLPVSGLVRLPAADQAGGGEGAEQAAARQQGADQRAAQREPR